MKKEELTLFNKAEPISEDNMSEEQTELPMPGHEETEEPTEVDPGFSVPTELSSEEIEEALRKIVEELPMQ